MVIRQKNGIVWNSYCCNAKLKHLRGVVIGEKRQHWRDMGMPSSYQVYTVRKDRISGAQVMTIDASLQQIKESLPPSWGGKSQPEILKERWTAFCSEPRDVVQELAKINEAPDEKMWERLSLVPVGGK